MMKKQINNINKEEIARLADYLSILSTPDDEMSLDKLDGVMHALAIGPTFFHPRQLLAMILGEKDELLDILSRNKIIELKELILRRYQYIIFCLGQPTPIFNPIYHLVEYRQKEYTDPLNWVFDFKKAVELNKNDWKPLLESEIGIKWFEPIHLLTSEATSEKEFEKIKTPVRRNKFCEKIENSILNIHQFWLPLRRFTHLTATEKTPQQKVGRNEPCPCGSGQKFKRCCEKND
jgi:uncharacterized protein